MKKIAVIILFLGQFSRLLAQQNTPFVVSKNTIDSDLSGYLFTTKNLKFKDDKDIFLLKSQFKKLAEKVANFGDSNDENWLMFNLKNESENNSEFVLYLDQTFLEKADFYVFQNDSLINKYLFSDTVKTRNRPFGEINFYYPFTAQESLNYCIFLRIKANPENGIAKGIVQLFDAKTCTKKIRNAHLEFGILIGFLILAITLGFILYYNDSKPIYGLYSAYISSVLLSYLCAYGYLTDMLDNTSMHVAKIYQSLTIISAVLHVLFISNFLDFDKILSQKSSQFVLTVCAIYMILAISNFILPISQILPIISRTSLILLGIFILSTTAWAFYQHEKNAKIYIIASVPGIIILLYLLVISLKILPIYPFVYTLLYYITIFEILVFGFGLVYQFTEEKREIELKLSEERRSVAQKLITTQEQERQRIAQDLHDDLGSTLSMLKNKLSESNEVFDNQLLTEMNYADKAVQDLRIISHNLMPVLFLYKGLKVAIQEFVNLNNNNNNNKENVHFIFSGIERKLDWETELSIFRIMKELLNNSLKHAKASNIEVQLIYFEEFLYVSVEDNGIGYSENNQQLKGIGLKNISLRAVYLNGKITKESSNKGTLFAIEIPYDINHQNKNSSD